MSFLSVTFLFFLPVVVSVWLLLKSREKTAGGRASEWFLLAASLFFYGWYVPGYLILLLITALISWSAAHHFRTVPLYWAVALLLFPLLYFKYKDLFLGMVIPGFLTAEGFLLPLGISFFTFQSISYTVDVRKGIHPGFDGFHRFLLYISFFPQLVAGPIVLARHFDPFFSKNLPRSADWKEGLFFLLSGYLKKAVLADRLALTADPVFADPQLYGAEWLWLGLLAYSVQIYLDFSGYSDIAIGAALFFGIRLPENFRFPYHAESFRDFWRRWHITLSAWLRDYLYIPLGGSRNGQGRMFAALILTMTLGGIWHGAHWNFLLWGLAHGLLLSAERIGSRFVPAVLGQPLNKALPFLQRAVTLGSVSLLWVLFRTGSEPGGFQTALDFYRGLITGSGLRPSAAEPVFVLSVFILLAFSRKFYDFLKIHWSRFGLLPASATAAVLALVILLLSPESGTPFIYFVF